MALKIKNDQLLYPLSGSFSGSFSGDGSQLTGIVSSKWSGSNPITRDSNVEITGSLKVTNGITGSLFGTSSFALTASFVDTTTTNTFVQGGNSFGTTALLGTNDNNNLAFETSGSVRMFISSSGFVGIGTNTPSYALDVSSTTGATAARFNGAGGTATVVIGANGNLISQASQFRLISTGATPLTLGSYGTFGDLWIINGNTGIGYGTTVPTLSSRFSIRGSGATSSTTALRIENNNASASLVVTDDIRVGIGIAAPSASLQVAGDVRLASAADGANALWIYRTSNNNWSLNSLNGVGEIWRVAGNSQTFYQVVTTSNGLNVTPGGNSTTAGLTITTGSYPAATLLRVDTNALVVTGSRVGIGKTNPAYALDVQGSLRTNGNGLNTYYFLNSDADNREAQILLGNTAGRAIIGLRANSNNLFIKSSNGGAPDSIVVDYNNGNVGISTVSPSASLHISGASSSTLFEIDSPALNNIMFVSGSGRVGIGTGTPLYSLDVNGTIRSQGQLIVVGQIQNPTIGVVDVNGVLYSGTGVSIGVNSTNTARLLVRGSGATSSTTALRIENSNATASLVVRDDGWVGIGTATPTTQLEVFSGSEGGTIKVSNSIYSSYWTQGNSFTTTLGFSNSGKILWNTNTMDFVGSGVTYRIENGAILTNSLSGSFLAGRLGTLGFQTYGSTTRYNAIGNVYTDNNTSGLALFYKSASVDIEGMRLTSIGRVGIGTGTPASRLHTVGDGIINIVQSTSSVSYTQYYTSGSGTNSTNDGLTVGMNGLDGYMYLREAGNLVLGTSDAERLRVTSAGLVGVGPSGLAPTARLHVRGTGATSSTTALRIENSNTSASLVVLDDGNVGIGEASPLTVLDVRASSNTTITPLSSVPNTATTILIGNTGTNGVLAIGHNNTGQAWLQARSRLANAAANSLLINPLGGNVGIGRIPTSSLDVAGTTRLSSSFNTAISGSTLTVIGSGSAQPIFTVQGSQGELFSITDSLSGSLFSVNDISGLPIMEVFSDNTILMGDYQDPMLLTTRKITQTNSGSFVVYSIPTASYDGAFIEYTIKSGSNARAGTIMSTWAGSSIEFTEVDTMDIGSTAAVGLIMILSGSNAVMTGSSSTGAWTIRTIIRTI